MLTISINTSLDPQQGATAVASLSPWPIDMLDTLIEDHRGCMTAAADATGGAALVIRSQSRLLVIRPGIDRLPVVTAIPRSCFQRS
jgi:hypothetical protein